MNLGTMELTYQRGSLPIKNILIGLVLIFLVIPLLFTTGEKLGSYLGQKTKAELVAENQVLTTQVKEVIQVNEDNGKTQETIKTAVVESDKVFVQEVVKSQKTQVKIKEVQKKAEIKEAQIEKDVTLSEKDKEMQLAASYIDSIWETYELVKGTP